MKKITVFMITGLTALFMASPLFAMDDATKGDRSEAQQMSMKQQAGNVKSAQDLLGMNVVSQTGEEVGTIQDIKLDIQSGRIGYVSLAQGGVLGMGEETTPIPLNALNFEADQERATLTVDQSKLDNAPKQADLSDQSYQRELETHYGVSPIWEDEQKEEMKELEPMKDDMKK